ncbi:MAG: hypothetical protein IPI58_09685 [Alphaproteobacteria bacterium]|nr:MAG: hypothetical protein IPI58_09685 [Alphaproteobacteria bacterium]
MPLPYENATSGASAINDVQKLVEKFGCSDFGVMQNFQRGETVVRFAYKGVVVEAKASANGYARAWLRENSYSKGRRCSEEEHRQRALKQGQLAVCSILRDWIKAQLMAIETDVLSFESAFMGQILLPNGKTASDLILPYLPDGYLLPKPEVEE